jgi:SWI/SNF-related matrix-associated actin-dependent regulator 1 of chromatin subfamily A
MNKLYTFQIDGIDFLAEHKSALLADEQGLGKTIQAIVAIDKVGSRTALIVCKAGLKLNWQIELERWLEKRGRRIFVVNGTKSRIPDKADIVIVNYDLLAISDGVYKQVVSRKWCVGVFDEAHFLKGRTSKRTKAILLRNGIASRCEFKWFMTGTPVLNRPEELYPILKAAAPGVIAPHTTFDAFARYFCNAWWDGFQLVTSGSSHEAELNKRLSSGFMLRRLKKDVLKELPDKSYQLIAMPPANAEIKKLVAKEFNWVKEDAEKINGVSSGNDISILRHELARSKVKAAVAHIEDLLQENEKIVVFCYHRDVIRELFDLLPFPSLCITGDTPLATRQEFVSKFQNDSNYRVFIGQIQAAGDGITLTAASTVVFVESSWVPGEIDQATDRLHRIGQKSAVLVQFLVIEDSLEQHMLRTVIDKKQTIKEIVDGDNTESAAVDALFT